MKANSKQQTSGRPTIFADELVEIIIGRMNEGETLKHICASEDMPSKSTLYKWRKEHPEFDEQVKVARENQVETWLEECKDIADDAIRYAGDRESGSAYVQAHKLKIETNLKLASRFAPHKFSETTKQEIRQESTVITAAELTEEQLNIIAREEAEALATIEQKLRH